MKFLQRQEIEVFYVIPSLRKHLAMEMKQLGLKQKEIAVLLSIEEAAVSQYVKGKRGNNIEFSEEVQGEVKTSARLIRDKISLLREMQRLIRIIMSTGELCKIHKELCDISEECTPGLINCFEIRK